LDGTIRIGFADQAAITVVLEIDCFPFEISLRQYVAAAIIGEDLLHAERQNSLKRASEIIELPSCNVAVGIYLSNLVVYLVVLIRHFAAQCIYDLGQSPNRVVFKGSSDAGLVCFGNF